MITFVRLKPCLPSTHVCPRIVVYRGGDDEDDDDDDDRLGMQERLLFVHGGSPLSLFHSRALARSHPVDDSFDIL